MNKVLVEITYNLESLIFPLTQRGEPYPWGPGRMMGSWGYGMMGWFGPIIMFVFWGLLILVLILLARWLWGATQKKQEQTRFESPLDILERWYAIGKLIGRSSSRRKETCLSPKKGLTLYHGTRRILHRVAQQETGSRVLLLKPYEPLPGRHSAERKPTACEDIVMSAKRIVEVFTAGCPVCQGVVEMVNELACPNCDVTIYNLNRNEGIDEAKAYGVTSLPSVVVNGQLLECCKRSPITREDLENAGIGKPL